MSISEHLANQRYRINADEAIDGTVWVNDRRVHQLAQPGDCVTAYDTSADPVRWYEAIVVRVTRGAMKPHRVLELKIEHEVEES